MLGVAVTVVLLLGGLTVAVLAQPAADTPNLRLSSGSAWLISPSVAAATLVDGPSEEVVASVRVDAHPGDNLTVTQAGTDAYVVNHTTGTVARIDGATQQIGPARQFADSPDALRLVTGPGALYALDTNRGLASRVNPDTLQQQSELSVSTRPGLAQGIVDDNGRLWVIDTNRGELTVIDGTTTHTTQHTPNPDLRLVAVHDHPVLADLNSGALSTLDNDGQVTTTTCLDIRNDAETHLIGSTTENTVYAAVNDTGTLLIAATDTDDCHTALPVSQPGQNLGPPVTSSRYLFVPNLTTGTTTIVDTHTRKVLPPELTLVQGGHRFELIAKDGLVFYNDLDSEKAGVLTYDGTTWHPGQSLTKYNPANGEPAQLDTTQPSTSAPVTAPTPAVPDAAQLAADQQEAAAQQEAERQAAEQQSAQQEAERQQAAQQQAEQQEAARQQAEQEEAQQQEAQRQAEQEAARQEAARQEAERQAAEQEAARLAAEQEAARLAVEQEAARLAAEQEAARLEAERQAAAAGTARIERPSDGGSVASRVVVEGTASVPAGKSLWIVIRPPDAKYYLTTRGPVTVGPDGKWATSVGVGRPGRDDFGFLYDLYPVFAPATGSQFAQFIQNNTNYGPFLSLPPDTTLLDGVQVTLVK